MNLKRIFTDPKERQAYKYILGLTLPIVIQNLFNAAVSSADVLMLNSVGQDAISSVSLATQYSNILMNIFYGLGSGVSMLCAQYWGKQDIPTIERVQGIALRFTFLGSMIFAIPSLLCPEFMMTLYTNDATLIPLGASYLRIVGIGHLFWGIAEAYFQTLRSVERVKVSTAINVFTLFLNISLNAVFIFGLFGAPKLGVRGVALATTIARIVQFIICLVYSHCNDGMKLRFSAIFEKNPLLLKDFVRLSLPALANSLIWGVAFSMYTAILGHLSSDVVAANSVVTVVRSFGTVLCYAVSSSAGIIIGKDIGAKKMEEAKADSRRAMVLMVVTGLIGGLVIFAITPIALSVASLSPTAMRYLKIMLYINCFYIMGTATNGTMINGIFRAGGDSKFGMICDIFDMWVYAVPLGFLAAFVFKLPPMVVYILLCTDEFVKWPWVFGHYRSGKWLNNITRDFD